MIGRFGKLLLAVSLSAAAMFGTQVTVTFHAGSGVSAINPLDGDSVGPYTAYVNGVLTTVYCDDFSDSVSVGEVWTANVTNLSSPTGSLKYGNLPTATTLYTELAWLTTQFATQPTGQWGALQTAIWLLANPSAGVAPDPNTSYWEAQAALPAHINSLNKAAFEILTAVATANPQPQELLVYVGAVPEPATYALFGSGIILLSLGTFRRRLRRGK